MADAAVEFLLKNLNDLLVNHASLLHDTRSQIEDLEKDIRVFRAFLKDSIKRRRKSEGIQMLVRNIRDTVYEVEDIIDTFVTQASESRSRNRFTVYFNVGNLHYIVKHVELVRKLVEQGRIDFALKSEKPEGRPQRQKYVVGFEDVSAELIDRLTTETDYLDIISLIGMVGLGKTTLAWKIFNDADILYEFPIRIWLSISQRFSDKDIFLAILKRLTTLTEDLRSKDEQELYQIITSYLAVGKFLIVMDDVWSTKEWDRLRVALPLNNKMGKVLITSGLEELGKYASHPRNPITLRLFSQAESWELLQVEAFGQLDCPSDLYNVGQLIARDCKGLPLAIVIIGGILAAIYSVSDLRATKKEWYKVSTWVREYLSEDPEDRIKRFISFSYDQLPYYLQACFLYLGMFPEDYEIPVPKLIRMWIAEGFIHQMEEFTLEETAEKYLEDLVCRNLVKIDKMKPNGKIKTCHVHDFVRAFCSVEADEKENFLKEIKYVHGVAVPSISSIIRYRRLAIHSNCLEFLSSKPFGPRVHSFVCIANDEFILPPDESSAIPAAFKLLRVLDAKPIIFTRIPVDMYELFHLRFVVLSCNLQVVPEQFSKLWNIQTFIVNTTSRTLEVEADIWKMPQLRHFKTNASATLLRPNRDSEHGAEIQTLGTISPESCTAKLLRRASNLMKLGIRGQLALLFEGQIGSFESMVKLKRLEKLELINDVHPRPASDGRLRALPLHYQFPSTLRSLTLCATNLRWSYMSTLGLLENLEALKLKDKAFMGRIWEGVGERFYRLEFLHIDHTDLCVWEASSHHFPSLKGLELQYCENLVGIPIELADIPSFQKLELHTCKSAASSARRIQEEKKSNQIENSVIFNLSIFPAMDYFS